MTRTTLLALTLAAAGAAVVAAASALEPYGAEWLAVAVAPLAYFLLVWGGREAHRGWVRWNLRREARAGAGGFARAIEIWASVPKVSSGEAWFTRNTVPAPDLERAVLFPDAIGNDEESVVADIEASTPASRRALVAGLRELEDLAVEAIGWPLHPLYPEAEGVLGLLGHAPPRLFTRFRAEAAWRTRRPTMDPAAAEEAIALRLLEASLPGAALAVIDQAPESDRSRRLRRLARFLSLMRRGDAVRADEYAAWAPELLLLAGRSMPDLVPGSPVLSLVEGGAAELDRIVARAPETVGDLVALVPDLPDLAPLVRQVLSRILAHAAPRAGDDEIEPDHELSLHVRGLALYEEGRPREALAEFEGALHGAPDFPAAAYALAMTRRRLGDPETARDDLRSYAARRASDPDAQLVLARYLAEEGRRDDARDVFERTIRRFPHSLALRMTYAQTLSAWGRPVEAAAQVEAAHGDHPLDPRLALWAGRARVHGGRPKDAVRPLRLAADRLQGLERAEAQFWLFSAYREQGRHDKAMSLASKLVERLGAGQEAMLDEVAEYLEERHEFVLARDAADRARKLRGW